MYMMSNIITYLASIEYHWRHRNILQQSMVGNFPIVTHHDPLQYIHYIHLMQRGPNRGVTNNLVEFFKFKLRLPKALP